MSDSNAAENLPEDGTPEVQPAETKQDAKASADPKARIAELEKQLADMKNEALRYLADAENTRRRAAKEKEDTAKYAVSKFSRDLLDVADNMQRALQSVTPDMQNNASVKNLCVGIEATAQQLSSVFERYGIQKNDPMGQMFDPNLHQVVSEVDAPDKVPGTVVQVLQTGYMIQGRLLREAMVAVAKGGQAAPPQHVDQKV
ncbi:MAG: nucleotide exchange factor GrpE [Alphaproteobacteria bacterium]|nr:nucleotide exchange factor GrpE [Alphaproteobacteria bacterium]